MVSESSTIKIEYLGTDVLIDFDIDTAGEVRPRMDCTGVEEFISSIEGQNVDAKVEVAGSGEEIFPLSFL